MVSCNGFVLVLSVSDRYFFLFLLKGGVQWYIVSDDND